MMHTNLSKATPFKMIQFQRNPHRDSTERLEVHEVLANRKVIGTVFQRPGLNPWFASGEISKFLGFTKTPHNVKDLGAAKREFRQALMNNLVEWPRMKEAIPPGEKAIRCKIRDCGNSGSILECLEHIRRILLPRNILFGTGEPDLDLETWVSHYPSTDLKTLCKNLHRDTPLLGGEIPAGNSFEVYHSHADRSTILEVSLEIHSRQYYTIYVLTPEGIVMADCALVH